MRRHRPNPTLPQLLLRDRSGATAVEFALVLPVLLIILALIVEAGQAVWVQNVMQLACDEAARFAAANPTATTTEIINVAENMAVVTSDTPAFSATLTTGSATSPGFATCTASYDYPIRIPMVSDSLSTVSMRASTRIPVIQ